MDGQVLLNILLLCKVALCMRCLREMCAKNIRCLMSFRVMLIIIIQNFTIWLIDGLKFLNGVVYVCFVHFLNILLYYANNNV